MRSAALTLLLGLFSVALGILRLGAPASALGARVWLTWLAWHYAGTFAPAQVVPALAVAGAFCIWVHIEERKPRVLASAVDCMLALILLAALGGWGLFPRLAPAYAAWTLVGASYYGVFALVSALTQWDKLIDWHKRLKLAALAEDGVAPPLKSKVSKPPAEDAK